MSLYQTQVKYTDGSSSRVIGSVTDDLKIPLKIAYRKYTPSGSFDKNRTHLNLVFICGNGMNKGLWNYHIHTLYKHYQDTGIPIGTVLALDWVCQGDLYAVNGERLGFETSWLDFAKDVEMVLLNEIDVFISGKLNNILVGHSMGGCVLLMVSNKLPMLFQSIVIYNPVSFTNDKIKDILNTAFDFFVKKELMKDTWKVNDVTLDAKGKAHPGALPCGPIHPEVLEHFTKKSFFKKFDPRVLRDMLADEIVVHPENGKDKKGVIKIKATEAHQLSCYYASFHSVLEAMKMYQNVTNKVYFIRSEDDVLIPESYNFTKDEIPNCEFIEAEGEHLAHGIDPDAFIELLELIIDKTNTEVNPISPLERELELKKKYGLDYRKMVQSAEVILKL